MCAVQRGLYLYFASKVSTKIFAIGLVSASVHQKSSVPYTPCMISAPTSLPWNEERFGTIIFILSSTPNCLACLVDATESLPKATLTNTSAPLLAMLRRCEL